MIFEFRPVGHLILISIRRIFPGASHFSKRCSSTVYMKLALDLVGQIFLKMMLGTCLNEITKKIQGGGDLPWMMPCSLYYWFCLLLVWKSSLPVRIDGAFLKQNPNATTLFGRLSLKFFQSCSKQRTLWNSNSKYESPSI